MSGLGESSGAPSGTGGGIHSASSTTGSATTTAVAHVQFVHIAGLLPAPEGEVAKVLHATSFEYQRKQAGACYDFLTEPDPLLLQLNAGHHVYTGLVGVPKSNLFKFVYCAGVGLSTIGATQTLVDGQLLFLQGDGNADTGPPQSVCFPL